MRVGGGTCEPSGGPKETGSSVPCILGGPQQPAHLVDSVPCDSCGTGSMPGILVVTRQRVQPLSEEQAACLAS